MTLPLDDSRWLDLVERNPKRIPLPDLLRDLERDPLDTATLDLVGDQVSGIGRDLGEPPSPACLAAAPHLLRLARITPLPVRPRYINLLAELVVEVERAGLLSGSGELPHRGEVVPAYLEAVADALPLAAELLYHEGDEVQLRETLVAVAAFRGEPELAVEIREMPRSHSGREL